MPGETALENLRAGLLVRSRDELMGEIATERPEVRSRNRPESVSRLYKTLDEQHDQLNLNSPDRTQVRMVADGDTLDRLEAVGGFLDQSGHGIRVLGDEVRLERFGGSQMLGVELEVGRQLEVGEDLP